jgi:hypothetical protein
MNHFKINKNAIHGYSINKDRSQVERLERIEKYEKEVQLYWNTSVTVSKLKEILCRLDANRLKKS